MVKREQLVLAQLLERVPAWVVQLVGGLTNEELQNAANGYYNEETRKKINRVIYMEKFGKKNEFLSAIDQRMFELASEYGIFGDKIFNDEKTTH